ncbi:thioesterase domain-containing protein, partial [Micromonospora sp. KC213]|uniref:thioesterase domain-containing protein n=1 Tax=Micromonospora sp. KC213 TaxID=2530378 RepID=UPI001FB7426C
PAPAGEAYARGVGEAPVGEVETLLAGLWSELLGVERIGRRDSFFTLGGHSLLAVRLISKIQVELGKVITLQDVLVQPTIEGIASLVQAKQTKSTAVRGVVELNSAGSQRPLFIIHPASGEVGSYPALAVAIGRDTPVFGLEAAGLHEDSIVQDSVEGIAEEYLRRIRQVQPVGPYRLAAWSLGGVIAYEMARQLSIANENVEFLGLIDSANNHALGRTAPRYTSDVDDLLLRLPELIPAFDIGRLQGWGQAQRTVNELLDACQRAGYFDDGLTAQDVLRRTKAWRTLVSAAERYVPLPSGLTIHLFLAKAPRDREIVNSWRHVVDDRLIVENMEGDHLSMMEVPFCNLLGASIARALTLNGARSVATTHAGSRGTIAFILFPETSAFNASYNLARELKRSGYRVIYHGPSKYRSRVADQGFEYRSLDMLLPQVEGTRKRGLRAALDYWRAARLTMLHRLIQMRASDVRCETALIADQVDLVISDPSARIGVLPALKLGIPMIALNSTLATHRATGTPPVFSSLAPPDIHTLASRVRYSYAWSRCLFAAWRKQAAETGFQIFLGLGKNSFWAEVRRGGGRISWNEYGPRVALPELVTSPRSFDFRHIDVDTSRTYLGSSVDLRRADGDFSWDGFSAEKKTIYCSLGTYSHEYRHARRLFAAVIDAVRDRNDVQAIIQIGSAAEISDFEELPMHVRVVKFAPQLEILRKADVLITQAGHSSVMEASYFGVPMLAFPCWYDQFGNAARVAYHGTGIVGDIARINGMKIADMLETLDRGEFKAAASRMRAIFRSEMKPAAGVEVVEQMMRSTSSRHHDFTA